AAAFQIGGVRPASSQSRKQQAGMAEQTGKPLFTTPSPEPGKDFARYHGERFLSTFARVGIRPEEIHWLRHLYGSGKLDQEIELVLRNADIVRRVYAEVSNVRKDSRWLPAGVICDGWGRVGQRPAH